MSDLVLLDIDGVLADDSHRVHYALQRQWADYFDPVRVWHDDPLLEGAQLYHFAKATGANVAFLTGRREDLYPVTRRWLDFFEYDGQLMMRPIYNHAKLPQFKVDVMDELSKDYGSVLLYDDDPRVVEAVNTALNPQISAQHCVWYKKAKPLVDRALS